LRYYYRVAARDGAATRSPNSVVVNAINRPSAVTLFTTTSWTDSAIILNWRDASGELGYRIERSIDGANWTAIATVGKNIPSYTDSSLSSGNSYYFRIVSLGGDADGESTAAVVGDTRLGAVAGA